jgi:hypothetical protein
MIRGNIAIPDRDPKTWRAKGRKRKPAQAVPTIIENVPTPAEIAKERRRLKLPIVVAAMAVALGHVLGCASIAAYQASHPYYRFPGSGAGGGNN